MVKSVIITGRNVINDQFKNRYRFYFPSGQIHFKDHDVCLSRIQIWNSIYNITTQLRNNEFQLIWNADTATTYTITIPNGQYTVAELNLFLQYVCIQNNLYLITDTGDYSYYFELLDNPSANLVQLICYALPSTLPAGWTIPPGASWTLPLADTTPQIVFPADNLFHTLLGFDAGTYPAATQTTDYTVLAQSVDAIYNIQSLVVNTNLVYNNLGIPATQLYSFSLADIPFGDLVNASPSAEYIYMPVIDGIYSYVDVWFTDEDGNDVFMRDTDAVIILSFKALSH